MGAGAGVGEEGEKEEGGERSGGVEEEKVKQKAEYTTF